MIQIKFAEKDVDVLESGRYNHPDPKVQRKMEVLYLKSFGLAHHQIRNICRISEPTLLRYLQTYQRDGVGGLKCHRYKGKTNQLKPHAESLEAHFQEFPPHTCAQAREVIEQMTGVHRGLTQVRMFLHGMKMKYRKCGFVPGKADTPEKMGEQEEYLKKKSKPSCQKPKQGSGWSFS